MAEINKEFCLAYGIIIRLKRLTRSIINYILLNFSYGICFLFYLSICTFFVHHRLKLTTVYAIGDVIFGFSIYVKIWGIGELVRLYDVR